MVGTEAPSIRLKALRLPPSSRIATFSLTPSSVALATAAFTIFCASSDEILCFFTTLAIGHLPPLDMYSVLTHPFAHSPRLPVVQNPLARMTVPASSSSNFDVHPFML